MLGPMRPQPTKIWRRKFVKVLVVGDSGLGKVGGVYHCQVPGTLVSYIPLPPSPSLALAPPSSTL